MSYTRFSDDSDTYTLSGMAGYICVGCLLTPKFGFEQKHQNQTFVSLRELVEHLLLHIKHGHKVPRQELKRLYREAKAEKDTQNEEEAKDNKV